MTLGFFVGLFIGASLGVTLMALMVVSKKCDNDE